MKYIGFKRAYDVINKGGRLMKTHTNQRLAQRRGLVRCFDARRPA